MPLPNEKSPATMDELIAELHHVFSSDHVDIEYVNHLLLPISRQHAIGKNMSNLTAPSKYF